MAICFARRARTPSRWWRTMPACAAPSMRSCARQFWNAMVKRWIWPRLARLASTLCQPAAPARGFPCWRCGLAERKRLSEGGWSHNLVERRQQALQVVEVVFREFANQIEDTADARILVILEGGDAFRRHSHIDLALVVRIDTASNERMFSRFQGTNDPRHLSGQDTQLTLNVADDERFMMVEQRQCQKLHFLEVAGAAAAARSHQAELRNQIEKILREFLHAHLGSGGDHVDRVPSCSHIMALQENISTRTY